MSDLRERLQQAVGAAYRVERELGGGGMSRVFLAEETRLGRKVVIKILPPEMAAGVSAERFEREIQVAARLQHPHIVPLLTAGADGDLLYYVMPFIAGESLRAKLAREGELPIPDALRILREVIDALQYAHGEGVVHRDIKPDNVLLSGSHAVVTDFGVAKAVSASTGEALLTSVGIALGTPAYMAPEQAAAEPSVDHRADVYAVGALAYEMLSGRPPFTATTLQGLLAAQITQTPEALAQHRSTVPAALNELVMRCLHKKPADRWQHASDMLPHLDAMLTPTMGLTPTGTQPMISSGTAAAIQRAHPLRVAGITALAAIGVLAIVYALVQLLGLPDWVFTGAIGLLALGVPLMLLTGHHERRRAIARSTGRLSPTPPGGVSRHLTWKKAVVGSGGAFAVLALVAGGFMATRSLGIGPAATLMSRGVLTPEDTLLLVAEFADNAGDSALAAAVTAAVRIDFAQSGTFSLLSPQMIQDGLELMRRERGTPLTGDVARELARRVNLKALVVGEVSRLGTAYVFSASLISPETGEVLAAERKTAAGDDEVVDAVDRVAKGLRERIGESLRSIRASQPLRYATTESLDALMAYTQSWDAAEQGESEREIALLEEAVALDPSFAAAYRRLAVAHNNSGSDLARARWAATKAFELRDRLPELERLTVTAYYYLQVDYDPPKAIAAQRAILEQWPFNGPATNNLALLYNRLRRWKDAEATVAPSIDSGVTYWSQVAQLLDARAAMNDRAGVESALATLAQREPGSLWLRLFRAEYAAAWGEYSVADSALAELERLAPATGPWGLRQVDTRYHLARVRGRLRD
jgi:tRNA A-37 threonylcarbamoyl transferase component Bud32/tetratricopeptide (TPR) repeat protein